MRKFLTIVIVCASLVLMYVVAGPYLTVSKIKTSIVEQDAEKLAENIKFPELRMNIKEQLNATIIKESSTKSESNLFTTLAVTFATTVVDKFVDSFITPSGLSALMEGERHIDNPRNKEESGKIDNEKLFENARYVYESLNKFSIWVPNYKGEETRFILKRDGIEWRLVNIEIPID